MLTLLHFESGGILWLQEKGRKMKTAEELVNWLKECRGFSYRGEHVDGDKNKDEVVKEAIEQAMQQARSAALEEAANICWDEINDPSEAAAKIRALKDK